MLTVDEEFLLPDVLVEQGGDLALVPAGQVQGGPAQEEGGVAPERVHGGHVAQVQVALEAVALGGEEGKVFTVCAINK